MKKVINSFVVGLFILFAVSCEKNDEVRLISPEYKNIEIFCGDELEIPVLASNWKIESIQDLSSGELLLDKKQNPITLEEYGEIKADNDWFTLIRNKENEFSIRLNENFSKTGRRFAICINENDKRDYITIIQNRGKEYKLVKKEVQEMEALREIYQSDKGCHSITLTNNTSEAVWKPSDYVFEDVVYSSQFQSDDLGAFDWISESDSEIVMPELIVDNGIRWTKNCVYKSGITTIPYITNTPIKRTVLVQPHTTLYLRGEITYCKRVCNYTFTIENETTGSRFNIRGIWTQITPIENHTTSSDKP